MTPYAVILILMLIGRVAYLRPDRACIIGLRTFASLSLLVYDLYINLFLTGMFLWPLFRSRLANPRIRKLAMRTLVAAGAALTTSTINIAVLTVMHGRQLGWVCLGSCGTDVMMNALVLFWVTDSVSGSIENTPATGGVGAPAPANGGGPGIPAATSHQSLAAEDGGAKSATRFATQQYSESMYDYMPHSAGAIRSPTMHRGRPGMDSVVFSKERRDKRRSGLAGKTTSILGKIGEALKSKNDDETRTHQMSVQVTVTTEMQEDIMMSDVKYVPSAESINESIATNPREAPDVEKGLAPPQT
ncbi:hypothetical protein FRC06_009330 [Ceratobasidium sp. 370]|nr:hypothetical protein FRC06_009330 [Ceratobasidium sp. 370]